MKQSKLFTVALPVVALLAIAIIYAQYASKTEASTATPPPFDPVPQQSAGTQTPIRQFLDELSGPKTAVGQVPTIDPKSERFQAYRKSRDCFWLASEARSLELAVSACQSMAPLSYAKKEYAECEPEMKAKQKLLAEVNASNEGQCPAPSEVGADYFAETRKAAAQGNLEAQLCYAASDFSTDGSGRTFTPADVAEYKKAAPKYLTSAIARGDWRAVQILSTDRFGDGNGLLSVILNGDVLTTYRMNRLLRMGAVGEYAEELDIMAQSNYLPADRNGQPTLDRQQISQADAWAKSMFDKYFKGSAVLTEAPKACTTRE